MDSEENKPVDVMIKRRGEPKNYAAERRDRRNKQLLGGQAPKRQEKQHPQSSSGRYIIFRPNLFGQGSGNIVHGPLAAHGLGEEFNHTVCHQEYKEFHIAFRPVDPKIQEACENLYNDRAAIEMRMVNYEGPVDECVL